MASFPFLVETNAHTRTHHHHHHRSLLFPLKFSTINAIAFEHSGTRGVRLHHSRYIRAVGKSLGASDDKDESEDVLEATIEKSKKVLALQRELLQQVLRNDFY